jgi:hypothetical protein
MELEDDGADTQKTVADREWNKLSNDFMTVGSVVTKSVAEFYRSLLIR